ncbi:MAG: bifunctional enoyl-CoA hydratase/phosphate acetyltransferase [Candidatus Cybelea sp.]
MHLRSKSALIAGTAELIIPVLVGNAREIASLARARRVALEGCEIVSVSSSREAAARAVELARTGVVEALMKGTLDSDELLHAIASPESGLHSSRRLSHVYVMDLPNHPEPLLITDAVVNITPTLDEKRDIVQNAIDLAHSLGITDVRVALLSAVETVNTRVVSTLDAAALCKMADRKQLTGAILDGPLALDDALDAEAARDKGIVSAVAGRANVLVVPDFESGNMLAKAVIYLTKAQAAGVVLGARIPIAFTSRADTIATHIASLAIARILRAVGEKQATPREACVTGQRKPAGGARRPPS